MSFSEEDDEDKLGKRTRAGARNLYLYLYAAGFGVEEEHWRGPLWWHGEGVTVVVISSRWSWMLWCLGMVSRSSCWL